MADHRDRDGRSGKRAAGPGTVPFAVRLADGEDRAWMARLFDERWAGPLVVSRGRVHDVTRLRALLAEDAHGRIGLATFRIDDASAELVTLDALVRDRGIGSALLRGVVEAVATAGCRRLWLITSNDNVDALRFYQRRGLRLVALHRGAVDEARRLKPEIPVVGEHEIEIHDELELELWL